MSYEIMTNEYMRRFDRPNVDLFAAIVAGGFAGIFYWIGGMPADVLKSRLQSGKSGKYAKFPHRYYSASSQFVQLRRANLTVFETFSWIL